MRRRLNVELTWKFGYVSPVAERLSDEVGMTAVVPVTVSVIETETEGKFP